MECRPLFFYDNPPKVSFFCCLLFLFRFFMWHRVGSGVVVHLEIKYCSDNLLEAFSIVLLDRIWVDTITSRFFVLYSFCTLRGGNVCFITSSIDLLGELRVCDPASKGKCIYWLYNLFNAREALVNVLLNRKDRWVVRWRISYLRKWMGLSNIKIVFRWK